MKEIYGVFSGCYSDWNVECYFESEEEAQQYCYYHNQTGDRYDKCYVIAIPFGNQEFPKTKLHKHWRAYIDLEKDSLKTRSVFVHEDDIEYCDEIKQLNLRNRSLGKNPSLVALNIHAQDVEVAKKIAQDIVAEFKSLVLVEGLTLDEAVKCINKG